MMETAANLVLIGAPVDCEGTLAGTSRAPEILRRMGLGSGFPSQDRNDLPISIRTTTRDAGSGVKAAVEVVEVTRATMAAVEQILRGGHRPLVVGGCCTPVLGAVAGARRVLGDVALAYVDGHADLYDGRTSPHGDFADMPLTFLLGRGGDLLASVVGSDPLVMPKDVALLGHRDDYIARPAGSTLVEHISGWAAEKTPDTLRSDGMRAAGEAAVATLRAEHGRYWVHIDWDVLDERAFPSADYHMPNGLEWEELEALLRPLLRSPHMIGLSLACYNPDNAGAEVDGRRIVGLLDTVLGEEIAT